MNFQSLKGIIHSEPLASKVFDAGIDCYLVGGYVRDALKGVRSKDMDFVVSGSARRLAEKVYQDTGGTIVEFKKGGMIRLVIDDATLDFSELRGNIEDDLRRRDFTMNAVAWSDKQGIIDPLNGLMDIEKLRIRAISGENFADDPLRLIRAYRFAGELGWKINAKTRQMVRNLKDLIRLPASERITSELFLILESGSCLNAVTQAYNDGLLKEILSLKNTQLYNNIKELSRLDSFLKNLPKEYVFVFDKAVSQGLSYHGIIRLEQLLAGSDFGAHRLTFSRAIMKRVEAVGRLMGQLKIRKNMGRKGMFNVFVEAGGAAMDIALLSRSRRWIKEAFAFINMKPVMGAEDIIGVTHAHGSAIGGLINEMRLLQFTGEIKNLRDAKSWLASRKGVA